MNLKQISSAAFAAVTVLAGLLSAQPYDMGNKVTYQGRPGMVMGKMVQSGKNFYRVRFTDTKTDACNAGEYCVPEAQLTPGAAAAPAPAAVFAPIPKTPQSWLDAHNAHRKTMKTPDLKWSTELATKAQGYASLLASKGTNAGCVYDHDLHGYKIDKSVYGENIGASMAKSPGVDKTPAAIIQSFMEEKPLFNPATSKCLPGQVCQHYTQVISQQSTEVGCGEAMCTSDGYSTMMYVCNYKGPGNIMTTNGYKDLYPGQR